jgi:hypothetical protein
MKLSLLWRRFEEFMASANAVSNRVSTESTPYVLYCTYKELTVYAIYSLFITKDIFDKVWF